MKHIAHSLSVLALITFAAPQASAIDIVETGDFAFGVSNGTLTPGTNTLSGRIDWNNGFDVSDYGGFTVPAGLEISGIDVAVSNFVPNPGGTEIRLRLADGSGVPVLGNAIYSQSTPGSGSGALNSPDYPLAAGFYQVLVDLNGGFQDASANYTYTFNTRPVGAPVPEPGSIALFIGMASVGGFILRRRRRG